MPSKLRYLALLACTTACAPSAGPASTGLPLPVGKAFAQNPNLPPGGEIVVLSGTPTAAGLYAFRVRLAPDLRILPHTHPDDRIYTVIEGTWTIGLGTEFDPAKLVEYHPGDVYTLPANTPHFHWARAGATVAQVTGMGPTATVYVHQGDDPRRH